MSKVVGLSTRWRKFECHKVVQHDKRLILSARESRGARKANARPDNEQKLRMVKYFESKAYASPDTTGWVECDFAKTKVNRKTA